MNWKIPDYGALIARLSPSPGVVDMVLDTDTYNEVDDQFALCYSLLSPEKLRVKRIYAAPFYNDRSSGPEDGMERSYEEIIRLLKTMGHYRGGFVFKGSKSYLPGAAAFVDSPAARDLVSLSMQYTPENPLYVAAIGAITNVASALLMEPAIAERIVIVWLGGNTPDYPHTDEFNLTQDVHAARAVLDSGAALVLVPCMGVASHLLTSVPEMESCLRGKNPVCDVLCDLFAEYGRGEYAWAKEIWDISAIAYLLNPEWVPTIITSSPLLTDSRHWARDPRRHPVRVAYMAHRNPIFKDMFNKLRMES
ncbi:MAG: nucleoside hydrolase [Defluviitaleaceae bacterium]|nr:nucleoside hydrolase [Defluviitaleaceae bacterium]MCL2835272.1 nucleoside hydrolase [Defluviitaleaceae bacterium]